MTRTLSIGIDAGGTRARLAMIDPDEPSRLVRAEGPGANLRVLGVDGCADGLAKLVRDVWPAAGGVLSVVAGVAGAGLEVDRVALADALEARLTAPARIRILTDVELALNAAFGANGHGMIVIAGTGSIVLARDGEGRLVRAGGWGRLLGDEGGGYRLGLAGLGAVADALDGGPTTALTSLAADSWSVGTAGELLDVLAPGGRDPGSFAPLVLKAATAGDVVARELVTAAASALSDRASWVARAHAIPRRRFALWGGLTTESAYESELDARLKAALPGWKRAPMRTSPVEAAVAMASADGSPAT